MKTKRAKLFDNRGFSLVELIIVIAIMAILAAVAIPTFAHFIRKANEASDIDFMNQLERAIVLANADREMGEITDLKVQINTYDGSILKITYTETHAVASQGDTDGVAHRTEYYTFRKGDDQAVSQIIDWEYHFKALDSFTHDETDQELWKMDHPNWDDVWRIDQKLIYPWDEQE